MNILHSYFIEILAHLYEYFNIATYMYVTVLTFGYIIKHIYGFILYILHSYFIGMLAHLYMISLTHQADIVKLI